MSFRTSVSDLNQGAMSLYISVSGLQETKGWVFLDQGTCLSLSEFSSCVQDLSQNSLIILGF